MKQRSTPPENAEGGNPFRSTKPSGVVRGGDVKKRVNVGKEGETPKKYFQIDRNPKYLDPYDALENIREDDDNSSNGEEGDENDDSNNDDNSNSKNSNNSNNHPYRPENHNDDSQSAADFLRQLAHDSYERPKTSRGKSHPSPDEFFNYIVPSPENSRKGGRSRLIFENNTSSTNNSNADTDTTASEPVLERDDAQSTHSASAEHAHISWSDSNNNDNSNENTNNENTRSSSERHALSDTYLLGMNLDGVSRDKQIALLGCWLFGSALRI